MEQNTRNHIALNSFLFQFNLKYMLFHVNVFVTFDLLARHEHFLAGNVTFYHIHFTKFFSCNSYSEDLLFCHA